VREWHPPTPAHKNNLQRYKKLTISREQYENAINSLNRDSDAAEKEIQSQKKDVLMAYVKTEQFKHDFLAPLRPTIVEGLACVHDYRQINAQIAQNINVIIQKKYQGADMDEMLESASEEEKTIYKASKLLEEKLNVAKLLLNPTLMNRKDDFRRFHFHKMVMKYIKIYSALFKNKGIVHDMIGTSHNEVVAHPIAVAVIPHTLIDNALKYSPKNGRIDILIQDIDDSIDFSVSSFGPRILPEETDKIFQPFYRGEAAKKQEEEGSGYGLYISQMVATQHLDTRITFEQDPGQKPRFGHWTVFRVRIPPAARNA